MAATKQCTKCGAVYPATSDYWHKRSDRKCGMRGTCKSCISERKRHWREANYDKACEADRQYYEANADKIRERVRQWQKENPDKSRTRSRHWREANPDKMRELIRQWRKANPDKVKAKDQRRRARKRNAVGSHTAAEVQEQYERQKGRCYWCGAKLPNRGWHADHVIPLSKGGSNYISNIVCACPFCNMSKHDKLPHEWDGTDRLL